MCTSTATVPQEIETAEKSTMDRQLSPSRLRLGRIPDAQTPISYCLLDFDTPLPRPNAGLDTTRPLPPSPSLRDYSDPVQWPRTRKYTMLAMLSVATMLTTYTAGAYSPPVDLLAQEFQASATAVLTGTTTFCVGFALAPMVLAPFSELNGRYPVFVAAGIVFVLSQALGGLVSNLAGELVARFLSGVGSSVFSTMIGGVIADLWTKQERNTPMAIYSGAVLVGTGLGPLASSLMVYRWGGDDVIAGLGAKWKWVFWHQVILDGICVLAIVVFFKESRGTVLISRKAKKLNEWYEAIEQTGSYGVWLPTGGPDGLALAFPSSRDEEKDTQFEVAAGQLQRIRWEVAGDQHRASIIAMIRLSVSRPFHLLFTEPVVFLFALWASFSWAVLFLCFSAIPLVFERQYGFNTQQTGYMFISMMIGSMAATIIGVYQERLFKYRKWQSGPSPGPSSADAFWSLVRRRFPLDAPEARLYLSCFTSVFLPLGLYLFGFSAQARLHWIVPALGIALATLGVYTIYLATFNYLADTYHVYASSALAAQGFCRYALAGIFPLVVRPLFVNIGEGGAGALLGAIATVLTAVPWVLSIFGPQIRRRSKFSVVSTFNCHLDWKGANWGQSIGDHGFLGLGVVFGCQTARFYHSSVNRAVIP
ncbi:major facilitator superfamily domain-containing protein [Aspergillus aurantiobrunneus]